METKHSKWSGGKGSLPRPTNQQKYEDNWERIFGKKKEPAKRMSFDLALSCLFKGKSIIKGSWGDEGCGRNTIGWNDGRYLKITMLYKCLAISMCLGDEVIDEYIPDVEDLFSGDWYEK